MEKDSEQRKSHHYASSNFGEAKYNAIFKISNLIL